MLFEYSASGEFRLASASADLGLLVLANYLGSKYILFSVVTITRFLFKRASLD